MPGRDRGIGQSLGLPLTKRIKDSRVLLVGAGGIGCEVLKNLVCCGFGSGRSQPGAPNGNLDGSQNGTHVPSALLGRTPGITVVDLDTIDLSNLNRQFLFRKHHIKKPKAFVAKETASQFNPSVNIDAHHASIFDSRYTVDFFEGFDVVFNALDNLAARRHVNRMCLAAGVPLIESGTTGYNGQVQAIKKGVTECYDCFPKEVQKSFPICTIRSTPSQPIHCIVWAKSYLLPELFGTSEDDSADMAVTEGDNAEEVAKLNEEAQALKKIRSMMGTEDFARAVFDKVYQEDIERLRSMTDMWKSKKPPESLRFADLVGDKDLVKDGQALSSEDQRIWTLEENLAVLCHSLKTLSDRVNAGESAIDFDKDDKDTLDLVAAAANLRAHIFGIPLNSEWEVKQMAGNIIPAIATTNAMTASLCVMQAFKLLRSSLARPDAPAKATTNNNRNPPKMTASTKPQPPLGGAKMVFLAPKMAGRVTVAEAPRAPNPACPVCSAAYARLRIPVAGPTPGEETTGTASLGSGSGSTLRDLVDLLRRDLGYDEFSIATDKGIVFDPDLDDNLDKPLAELDVAPESGGGAGFVTVTDDADEPKVDLVLSAAAGDAQSGLAIDPPALAIPLKPAKEAPVPSGGSDGDVQVRNVGEKRKREAEDEVESAKKRVKAAEEAHETITIEDDGVILLDD